MEHFKKLNSLDVNNKTEKKKSEGQKELTYLSWAWAWAEVKKIYPDANYEIVKFNGLPYVSSELGIMCYTKVTIENITHEMWLPVMNGANKAMKFESYKYTTKFGEKSVESATMFDVNKTIMRCLTKNLAMFGLGLYIYAGEDLPEDVNEELPSEKTKIGKIEPKKEELITPEQVKALHTLITKTGTDPEKIKEHYKVNSSKELTKKQAAEVIDRLSKKVEKIKESEKIKEDESLIPDNDYEAQHD